MTEFDQLPQDVISERAILGLIIQEPGYNAILQAIETVDPDDFQIDSHRRIYRHMLKLAETNETIDELTLHDRLKASGELERIGGFTSLSLLTSGIPMTDDIGPYVRILRRKADARRLIRAGQAIMNLALDEPDRDELVGDCQEILDAAVERSQKSPFVHISDAAREWLEEVQAMQAGPGGSGLVTKLNAIDLPLAGLQRSELVVIAGRPSQGKTTLALDLGRRLGLSGHSVAFFSLEMGKRKLGERTLAGEGMIDTFEFRTSGHTKPTRWQGERWEEAYAAMERLKQCGVWVCDDSSQTPTSIRAKSQRFKREHGGLDVLIIDYLGLMDFANRGRDKRYELVGEATRKMKHLARELDCALILVHQLNRENEKRGQAEPKLSDLADSGDIEKHADVVTFVYKVPGEGSEEQTFIKVAKNRNGPTAVNEVYYVRNQHRFENVRQY